jgi:hypothetical protein
MYTKGSTMLNPINVFKTFKDYNDWCGCRPSNQAVRVSFCEKGIPFTIVRPHSPSASQELLDKRMRKVLMSTGMDAENKKRSQQLEQKVMEMLGDDNEVYLILSPNHAYKRCRTTGLAAYENNCFKLIHKESNILITNEIIKAAKDMPLKEACVFVSCLYEMGVETK